MKISDKTVVQDLIKLCLTNGVKHIVISPGSRNAPLSISFNRHPFFETHVVPDERVAGFVALGLAHKSNSIAALICTSGSALLNYAPALSEAYYSHVPLLILSADRPPHLIDQREGQSIRQNDVFRNFVKGSFNLVMEEKDNSQKSNKQNILQGLELCTNGNLGPVHINIPFDEPLYNEVEVDFSKVEPADFHRDFPSLSKDKWSALNQEISLYQKILILYGAEKKDDVPLEKLQEVANSLQAVVMSECTANVLGENIVGCIDRNLMCFDEMDWENLQPDLLITMGGAIVSKKIKKQLREADIKAHWHVSAFDPEIDTYQHLSKMVQVAPCDFLCEIDFSRSDQSYGSAWKKFNTASRNAHTTVIDSIPFSDLSVFDGILKALPKNSLLHLANSSPVRYAQLFESRTDIEFHANRGVAGIDGSTSTALGAALVSKKTTTLISGDMSFFYDSNAFWQKNIPENLKVIVINNGGGGIFRIIKGPDQTEELEDFFEVHQENNVKGIAAAYGISYMLAENENELINQLDVLYSDQTNACIFEVRTPRKKNSDVLKKYFKLIKEKA